MQCSNHLKQLGLAAHNFSDAFNRMPPGYNGAVTEPDRRRVETVLGWENTLFFDAPWLGTHAYLLPYIEQQSLADRIVVEFNVDRMKNDSSTTASSDCEKSWWTEAVSWEVAHARVPTFVCPLTSPYTFSGDIYAVFHCGSQEMTLYGAAFSRNDLGLTNYVSCGGALGTIPGNKDWDQFRGVFGNRTKNRFADIRDGTSSTLLFGEHLGGISYSREDADSPFTRTYDSSLAWMGIGAMPTAWGLYEDKDPAALTWGYQGWWMYSSDHPGVVQFVFGDGSVHPLTTSIDYWAFVYTSGMRDGNIVDSEQLGF